MADIVADFQEAVEEEPKSSAPWLDLIERAERSFSRYQDHANRIDKLYADMDYLMNGARDREFALFWSNIEIEKPSVYARPPVAVIVPKFKDRRPIYRTASEFLERSTNVAFDLSYIDDVMKHVRDDLLINARGCAWVRLESKEDADEPTERICIEWLDRRDFVHEPTRSWPEVTWVARRAWLTETQMEKRFPGKDVSMADYEVRHEAKNRGGDDGEPKAAVWEIWHRELRKVVWVAEGVQELLEEDKPHLKLEGFYPCPKPAYGTLKRGTLIPAPDVMFYMDQLEEINDLTARIHALSGALQVRGFYPAGAGELGDAIESALAQATNEKVLIGISNWAAFGGGAAKDSIVWLPTDQVAQTIVQCVELRRQVIDDVYQIAGISDIQRGATEAEETLGAQQLKQQNGSYRVRDKQNELVRVARDLVRISAEIMAEEFSRQTLLDMSQMELPTDAEIRDQVRQLEGEAGRVQAQAKTLIEQAGEAAAMGDQEAAQQAEQIKRAATEQIEQLGQQAQEAQQAVTIDQVMKFLHDNKIRPFVLDIETDSTIYPDEMAEKQRRAEFLTAFGTAMQQLGALVQTTPSAAPFAGEILRFALAPYRAGRVMDGAIDDFVDQMVERAKQPTPPSPEMLKIELDGERLKQEGALGSRELDIREQEVKIEAAKVQQAPQIEATKEQIKAEASVQINEAQAQGDVIAEQARLDADMATTAAGFEAEAALEAQREEADLLQVMVEDRFRRDELAVDTALEYDKLAVSRETAEMNAKAKAQQPKGPPK